MYNEYAGNANYINIGRSILGEIGLAINSDNEVYDQDTFSLIDIEGKKIIFSFTVGKKLFCDPQTQIVFEPVSNLKMINRLFAYYLQKEEMEGNMCIKTWFQEEDDKKRTAITIVSSNGERFTSDYFYNPCLKFCDLILKFGYPMEIAAGEFNLVEFEIDPKTITNNRR